MTTLTVAGPMEVTAVFVKVCSFSAPLNIKTLLQVTTTCFHLPTLSFTVRNIYGDKYLADPIPPAELTRLISQFS
jgi:hypothetical protein